jgi:hypothetical protein
VWSTRIGRSHISYAQGYSTSLSCDEYWASHLSRLVTQDLSQDVFFFACAMRRGACLQVVIAIDRRLEIWQLPSAQGQKSAEKVKTVQMPSGAQFLSPLRPRKLVHKVHTKIMKYIVYQPSRFPPHHPSFTGNCRGVPSASSGTSKSQIVRRGHIHFIRNFLYQITTVKKVYRVLKTRCSWHRKWQGNCAHYFL